MEFLDLERGSHIATLVVLVVVVLGDVGGDVAESELPAS